VPVLASRISGSVGLLGAKYPGYFPVGDTRALAGLLRQAEGEAAVYARLGAGGARLAPPFTPGRGREGGGGPAAARPLGRGGGGETPGGRPRRARQGRAGPARPCLARRARRTFGLAASWPLAI